MVESLNMAFMMELPMVLIIVQRLGPSTGSATTGAQGDLSLLNGIISGQTGRIIDKHVQTVSVQNILKNN